MSTAEETTKPNQNPESEAPSMEEILKSIRGVISGDDYADNDILELTDIANEHKEDDKAEIMQEKEDSQFNDTQVEPDTLNSFAQPIAEDTEKSILDDIDAALEVEEVPLPPEPEPEAEQPNDEPEREALAPTMEDDFDDDELLLHSEVEHKKGKSLHLLGEAAAKKSSYPLKELVNSIHDKPVPSPYTRSGTSLEDLVIEAMKPFLADWLNTNLPVIVKKIVTKEIKRLIPKDEDD